MNKFDKFDFYAKYVILFLATIAMGLFFLSCVNSRGGFWPDAGSVFCIAFMGTMINFKLDKILKKLGLAKKVVAKKDYTIEVFNKEEDESKKQ